MSISGDRPVGSPADDLLGLAPFARALARSLTGMNPREGLALAVEGAWGAGKSSALALAEREIRIIELARLGVAREEHEALDAAALDLVWEAQEADRSVRIVRFNPWTWSGQDNLVRAFFAELSAQIGHDPEGKIKKAAGMVGAALSYGGVFAGAAALLASAANPALVAVLKPAGDVAKAAGDAIKSAAAEAPSLAEAKTALATALATALREAGGRVIVFIDDLDRLMPSEMRAMLSLVKALGDLPNVIYVLAYDPNVVRRALESERIEPDFVAKIVQVSLTLPPPRRQDMRALLDKRLSEATNGARPADEGRWERVRREALEPYLRTPRDVTRLANAVQVHWAAVGGELDLTDLVTLTTLRLFEPSVYRLIEEKNEGLARAGVGLTQDERDAIVAALRDAATLRAPAAARAAAAELYPDLRSTLSGRPFDGDDSRRRAERRICVEGHHRPYFAFSRDALMPSPAEIDAILDAADQGTAFGDALASALDDFPRARRLLEELEAQAGLRPPLREEALIAILEGSDHVARAAKEHGESAAPVLFERLARLFVGGVTPLGADGRALRARLLTQAGAGLAFRVYLLWTTRERVIGRTRAPFDEAQLGDACNTLAAEVAAACNAGTIWTTPDVSHPVGFWRQIVGRDAPAKWVAGLPDDKLAAWARASIFFERSVSGPGTATTTEVFLKSELERNFDVAPFIARLAGRAETDADAAAALAQLLEAEANATRL